jgi:hypothetical protein
MRSSLFQIITFIGLTASQEEKAQLPLLLEKAFPRNHVDLPPLILLEATGVCVPSGHSEVLLAAVYKSSGHA